MNLSPGVNSCSFQGNDPTTGEQQAVKVLDVPGLSAASLTDAAHADVLSVVDALDGGKLLDERSALFAGNAAYRATVTAADGSGGAIEYVYKPTVAGNLLVITHSQVRLTSDGTLGNLETNWSWQ
jgi:hypothetical protein